MSHGRVLRFLKEGTAAQHEAVERRVNLTNRLSNPSAYANLLGCFYGFYEPLEAALGQVAGYETVGLHFDERRKTPRLVADLAVLGHTPDELSLWNAPAFASLGEALGAMYVIEGATLGGQFITKAVESRLGFTPECGCAFFASYGDRVGVMWEAFREALVAHATTPEREAEIVLTATDTFNAFDGWLAAAEVTS
jgi:heme oxygenase (biliverdin-IX-beta and delta-forming)